jgi:hypothetical protein
MMVVDSKKRLRMRSGQDVWLSVGWGRMGEGGGWDEDPPKDPRDKEPADKEQRQQQGGQEGQAGRVQPAN